MHKDSKIKFYFIFFILISIFHWLVFLVFFRSQDPVLTFYVSQQEILDLEKVRVSNLADNNQKQLFFGKSSKAAEYIERIGESYRTNKTNIVFSNDRVYGKNVKSISEEVYKKVINELKGQDDD